MQIEREEVTAEAIHRNIRVTAGRLITIAGMQAFTYRVGLPKRCKVLVDGCNWSLIVDAPAGVRAVAQPAIDDAKQRFNLKQPVERLQFKRP